MLKIRLDQLRDDGLFYKLESAGSVSRGRQLCCGEW
jgi:hypothetical protein